MNACEPVEQGITNWPQAVALLGIAFIMFAFLIVLLLGLGHLAADVVTGRRDEDES